MLKKCNSFTVHHRNIQSLANSPRYFASKVWNIVPSDIKNASNLNILKKKIRKWEPKECHCNLCQTYISNLAFVNLV